MLVSLYFCDDFVSFLSFGIFELWHFILCDSLWCFYRYLPSQNENEWSHLKEIQCHHSSFIIQFPHISNSVNGFDRFMDINKRKWVYDPISPGLYFLTLVNPIQSVFSNPVFIIHTTYSQHLVVSAIYYICKKICSVFMRFWFFSVFPFWNGVLNWFLSHFSGSMISFSGWHIQYESHFFMINSAFVFLFREDVSIFLPLNFFFTYIVFLLVNFFFYFPQ